MRLNVWVPDELVASVRERVGHVNVSRVLQDGLRGLLKCPHDQVVCSDCAATVDKRALADEALSTFYRQLMWELHDLIHKGGTCEGAAQIAKSVAETHHVSAAKHVQLTRAPRGERARREWERRWLETEQRLQLE